MDVVKKFKLLSYMMLVGLASSIGIVTYSVYETVSDVVWISGVVSMTLFAFLFVLVDILKDRNLKKSVMNME